MGLHRRNGESGFDRWQTDFRADWEFYPGNTLRAEATRYFNDDYEDEGVYRIYYYKRY